MEYRALEAPKMEKLRSKSEQYDSQGYVTTVDCK